MSRSRKMQLRTEPQKSRRKIKLKLKRRMLKRWLRNKLPRRSKRPRSTAALKTTLRNRLRLKSRKRKPSRWTLRRSRPSLWMKDKLSRVAMPKRPMARMESWKKTRPLAKKMLSRLRLLKSQRTRRWRTEKLMTERLKLLTTMNKLRTEYLNHQTPCRFKNEIGSRRQDSLTLSQFRSVDEWPIISEETDSEYRQL